MFALKHRTWVSMSRHVKFSKKNAGQPATTSFHSSILRARRVIFAAMHKKKLKFKVMLRVTVLNSVKRKINLLKKMEGILG